MGTRTIVPSSLSDLFKCFECWQFLSVGPVYITREGKNICGRCDYENIPDIIIPLAQNCAYEAAASLYLFPCIYQTLGCPTYIPFNDATQHETFCSYRTYKCPLEANNCTWSGIVKRLPEHYLKDHREFCVEDTAVELTLSNNILQPYLLYYKGLYLLLQIKSMEDLGILWFNLIYLEDPEDVQSIRYSVQFGNNHTKSHFVLEDQCPLAHSSMHMDLKKCMDINLKGLFAILKNPETISCNVSISIAEDLQKQKLSLDMLRCPSCDEYMSPPIYECEYNHICCADCKGFEMDCVFCKEEAIVAALSRAKELEIVAENVEIPCRWKGCTYKSKGIREHEQDCLMKKYKCPFRSCTEWAGSLKILIKHLKAFHPESKIHVTSNGTHTVYQNNSYNYIIAHGEIFWCYFRESENKTGLLQIYYKGRPSLASNFKYELEVVHSNELSKIYTLSRFIKNRYEVQVPYLINKDTMYKINIIKCSKLFVSMHT